MIGGGWAAMDSGKPKERRSGGTLRRAGKRARVVKRVELGGEKQFFRVKVIPVSKFMGRSNNVPTPRKPEEVCIKENLSRN